MTQTTEAAQTVRELITSVTKLARHLGISANAVYRWIDVDRIPAHFLIKVANFYDVEIPLHLAQSPLKNKVEVKLKPAHTLPTVLEVYHGRLTMEEAAAKIGCHLQAVKLILTHWGTRLPLLVQTMQDLTQERITLDDAAKALGVTKFNIHTLRRKYGLTPPKKAAVNVEAPIVSRRERTRQAALATIEGELTLEQAAEVAGQSWRSVHRAIAAMSPEHSLIELTHWPKSFRKAYSDEIDRNLDRIVPNLYDFANNALLFVKKEPKYPKTPPDWRKTTLKRMMIAVLLDEASLEAVAAARGADPKILEGMFTGDLRPLDLTWPMVMARPLSFQIALAELLIAIENPKRRQL